MTFRTSVISMVTQTHPNRFQPFGYFKSKAHKPNLVSAADMRNTVKSLNAFYDFLLRSSFCNAKKSMLQLPKCCSYNRNIDILFVRFWYIILFFLVTATCYASRSRIHNFIIWFAKQNISDYVDLCLR